MRHLFKKKSRSIELFSPTDGEIIPIEAVPDKVFSSKMMGEGFAVKPNKDEVFSPVNGEVISIFPTKHAIALKTSHDLEILLHIGIDTVELQGKPFELFVEPGEIVTSNTKLAKVNRSYLTDHGKSTDIMVVLTNSAELDGHLKDMKYGQSRRSISIGKVSF
ncbi:PTS glucose transporter subunit IIA [Enterococcus sp.]|uniref:PTS sugar transporter subunit IIA n=1 Tax=Enterococcus sp. TaxID=35783 RepID=UPI002914E628|nr:PTS glucose transporter subunit IIA [Enterococcus sp.]MDU5336554.1 PTS glucose transporter subunit IIA [Enterococcus sp.]